MEVSNAEERKIRKIMFVDNWADEFDVAIVSYMSEELYRSLMLHSYVFDEIGEREIYFGTNEWITYQPEDFKRFLENAEVITEEEYKLENKILRPIKPVFIDLIGKVMVTFRDLDDSTASSEGVKKVLEAYDNSYDYFRYLNN